MIEAPTEDGQPVGPGELTRDREISLERAKRDLAAFANEHADQPWEAATTMRGSPCLTRPGFELHWVVDDLYQLVIISTRYRICGNGKTPAKAVEDASKQLLDFRDELNRYIAAM